MSKETVVIMHPETGALQEVRAEDKERCLDNGFIILDSKTLQLRKFLQEHTRDRHKGKTAIVLANGPSLAEFTPEQIEALRCDMNAVVFGCNNMWQPWKAVDDVPWLDYWIFLDDPFFHRNMTKIGRVVLDRVERKQWPPIIATHFMPNTMMLLWERVLVDTGRPVKQHPGPYRHGYYFNSHSSGAVAVMHAMHLGCTKAILIGHDCTADSTGRSHSYGTRDDCTRGYTQGGDMVYAYGHLADWAREIGMSIINCSPATILKCWPVCHDLNEAKVYLQEKPNGQAKYAEAEHAIG